MIDENDLWILSYYRISEISGALFFGRLARSIPAGPIQHDLTKHFSDEAIHAWYWTECIDQLGSKPLKLKEAYQDQYLSAAGMPANIMEILAITQVFERRVINQYARHSQIPEIATPVLKTLQRIMIDERWHIQWVADALGSLTPEYGKEVIDQTVQRYWKADQEVYQKTLQEHEDRIAHLIQKRGKQ
jgi:bacterioferritin (cytochrome b1)